MYGMCSTRTAKSAQFEQLSDVWQLLNFGRELCEYSNLPDSTKFIGDQALHDFYTCLMVEDRSINTVKCTEDWRIRALRILQQSLYIKRGCNSVICYTFDSWIISYIHWTVDSSCEMYGIGRNVWNKYELQSTEQKSSICQMYGSSINFARTVKCNVRIQRSKFLTDNMIDIQIFLDFYTLYTFEKSIPPPPMKINWNAKNVL